MFAGAWLRGRSGRGGGSGCLRHLCRAPAAAVHAAQSAPGCVRARRYHGLADADRVVCGRAGHGRARAVTRRWSSPLICALAGAYFAWIGIGYFAWLSPGHRPVEGVGRRVRRAP
jgi:hypothetical protein